MQGTEHTTTAPASRPPAIIARLHLVAKLSLWTGLSSSLAFAVVLFYLGRDQGSDYASVFHSLIMTRHQLKPVLFSSGTILLATTGLVTWLIAIYSTFRVAGPLYQFTQTLKKQIEDGPHAVPGIIATNDLQSERLRLAGAANRLQYHYDSISELVELANAQLNLGEPNLGDGLRNNLKRLKEIDSLVKT